MKPFSLSRIAVVGVGGIGGLLSAVLLRQYGDAVSLVARGNRAEALRQNGLTLRSDVFGAFTVHPAHVGTATELPPQDLILICVKNGALEQVAAQIVPLLGPDTVVLTVMNGVTAGARLRRLLPRVTVLESVIYTVSAAQADFSVTQTGKFTQLFTGAPDGDETGCAAAKAAAALLSGAGLDCQLKSDLPVSIWSKYVLNCAYNVATARWGCPIGGIKADPARMADCAALLTEARAVGIAQGVALPADLVQKHLRRIEKTADSSGSSLSRDFAAGRAGELEVFSGDLVRMAAAVGVDVPVSQAYYQSLLAISKAFPSA